MAVVVKTHNIQFKYRTASPASKSAPLYNICLSNTTRTQILILDANTSQTDRKNNRTNSDTKLKTLYRYVHI